MVGDDEEAPSRRERIVEVALAHFTRRGFDGTTIGQLASALDISKAAIGYYFPAKEDFLDELVGPFLDRLDRLIDARTDAVVDPRELLDGYLGVLVEHRDVAVWVDTDPALRHHPRFGRRLSGLNERVISALVTGDDPAERVRALAVLGGIWRPVRILAVEDIAAHQREIVEAALAGS